MAVWLPFRARISGKMGTPALARPGALREALLREWADMMERRRFLPLDVFRGMALCLMIIVNTPGAGSPPYPILDHAEWFGFTAADIVFPSFLFAVGTAMAFGTRAAEAEFWRRTLRRSAIILALGLLTYWFPFFRLTDHGWVYKPLSETRFTGVLQRIALCYFLAAVAARYLGVRGLLALSAGLLLGYWGALLAAAPDAVTAFSKTDNVGNSIDLAVFGRAHLYRGDEGFEPEGLLSTLPATVNVILGYLAGLTIRRSGANGQTVGRLFTMGVALILAALLWSTVFPIGKKLWTSSFVLLTVGIDLVVLAGLMSWIDLAKQKFGARFFEIFGRNPILLYWVAMLLEMTMEDIRWGDPQGVWSWFGRHVMQAVAPGPLGSLLTAILYMLLCWLVALWLDRRKILVRA